MHCDCLSCLDLRSFNTLSVTNMYGMFSDSVSIEELDLSNSDTNMATNMRMIFSSCSALEIIDISNILIWKIFKNQNLYLIGVIHWMPYNFL